MKIELINRLSMPTKHVLICEDDIQNQFSVLRWLSGLFDAQGHVQITVVPGAIMASGVLRESSVDLIILDHDMPMGNGSDLLEWLGSSMKQIPVITFSGIDYNNQRMLQIASKLGITIHVYRKSAVLSGEADHIVKDALKA